MISWPAANGIICSSCAPMRTIEPEGTCWAMASRMESSLEAVVAVTLASPEMIGIERADNAQLGFRWRRSFDEFVGNAESPAGIGEDFFDADAGMNGGEEGFAIAAKFEDAESGDQGRGAGGRRQTVTAAPVGSGSEAGRSDVADAIDEAATIMSEQDDGAASQAGDIAGSAGTGEALHFVVAVAPSGIEISEAIDFGGAEKADVDAALLEEIHDVEHLAALGCVQDIRWIAHGVEQFGGRSFANDAVFEKSDGQGGVGATCDKEREHGQAHADEDDFAIVNFARGGGHHQLTEGVKATGGFGFLATDQIGRDLDENSNG